LISLPFWNPGRSTMTCCLLLHLLLGPYESLKKPHCIACARRHLANPGRNQGHGVRCWCSDAVTLSSTMHTGGFELNSSALTSSTLKWLHRIQCGFKCCHLPYTCTCIPRINLVLNL
jgi:hypothetical protein